MLILHICLSYNTIAKTIYHTVNITSTETKLFAIRYRINQAVQVSNALYIIVTTDAINSVRQIFDSSSHSYQLQSIAIAQDLRAFFNKNSQNSIDFGIALAILNGLIMQLLTRKPNNSISLLFSHINHHGISA